MKKMVLTFLLLLLVLAPISTPYPTAKKLVGRLSTLHHDVAGVVSILDEERILIEDFHYDGGVRSFSFFFKEVLSFIWQRLVTVISGHTWSHLVTI